MIIEFSDDLIDFDPRYIKVLKSFRDRFNKKPDVEAILFVIGIQEYGSVSPKFSKEQKQDLMHIAVCRLLSYEGYYEFLGRDGDNWPHWGILEPLPKLTGKEQELLLKRNIIRYFEEQKLI